MTPRCTADKWLLVVVVVCLSGIRTAESLNCTVHLHGDGTALYQIGAPAKPNWEADWKINGKVVAHEEGFNKTIVLQNTGNTLLLKAYHSNTTYIVDYTKWPFEVFCDGPISLGELPRDDANKPNWGAAVTGIVIAVLVTALLVILPVGFCWWKKKGFFRKKEKEQGDPGAFEPLNDDRSSDGMV